MTPNKLVKIVSLVFCALGFALLPVVISNTSSVLAQSETILYVSPAASDVILNNAKTINLSVTNGVNVNAFDVIVTYDPALLTLSSWSHGGYLSNLANVLVMNNPGSLRVVATQLARPGVSGDGILLDLEFQSLANGISPITITKCEFADPEGGIYYPTRVNGSLLVHGDPALINKYSVTGTITLQARQTNEGIPLSLGYGIINWLGPYNAISINQATANISLTNVYEDTYLITTAIPRYLNITAELNKIKSIASGSTTIAALHLRGGNAVWQRLVDGVLVPDTVIDSSDVSLVGAFYNQSGDDLDADVNYSGKVDIIDLALVSGNYDLTSASAYQDWIP